MAEEEAGDGAAQGVDSFVEVCLHHAGLPLDSDNSDLEAGHLDDALVERGRGGGDSLMGRAETVRALEETYPRGDGYYWWG